MGKSTVRFEGKDEPALIAGFNSAAAELVPRVAEYEEMWVLLEQAGFVVPRRENNLPTSLYGHTGINMAWVLEWAGYHYETLAVEGPGEVHRVARMLLTDLEEYRRFRRKIAEKAQQELAVREAVAHAEEALIARLPALEELPPIVGNPQIIALRQRSDPRANQVTLVCLQHLLQERFGFYELLELGG